MRTTISKLTSDDLGAIDDLMKRHSGTIGFLPQPALEDYLEKDGVLGAKTDDGKLAGYLLYGANADRFRIAHLCVAEDFQGRGIAKRLLENLKNAATTQKFMQLHCRRDFPAHDMWPKLGFVPLGEKPGRSSAGHTLTLWCLTLAPNDQLSLFQAKTSDDAFDVIIDAQIFFDFAEPDSDTSKPSKALLSDFLIDSLNFWITDELFNEIDRHSHSEQRQKSRGRACELLTIEPDRQLVEHFDKLLRKFFPGRTQSQESDVRQLAKAAASDVKIFVTRDQALLKKSEQIAELTGLEVLSPATLIVRCHERFESHSYVPDRISGFQLRWQRLTSDDLASFPFASFLNQGERQGPFREKLESFLASPQHDECELLLSGDERVAIRVLANGIDKALTVHLGRVAPSVDRSLFQCFLVADTVHKAVAKNLDVVKFEASLTPSLVPDLLEIGFTKCSDSFVRFCFPRCLGREDVLSIISESGPESINNYRDMSDIELERHCSPLSLASDQSYFLVPIKPGYARSLIDSRQSADDLFGGKTSVLLRWGNVYYRKKTHHKMLKPPARILWYESEPKRQIVAVSHLDAVEADTPKALFKKFKKFGILAWKDIYKMCDGDPSKEIMALQFSHTFLFREPVSLEKMRTVFREAKVGLSLQSPLELPPATFQRLFQLGYPYQS